MRYRPFGTTGKAVSAVSLALHSPHARSTAEGWRGVIFNGMECGVNCFDMVDRSPPLAGGMGQALQVVERRLLFLIWTIRGDPSRPMGPQAIADSVRDGLKYTGARYFDVLMLDETAFTMLTPDAMEYMAKLRAGRFVQKLGLRGDNEILERGVSDASFDVLATSYSLKSEWKSRRLLREAAEKDMVTIAYDVAPQDLITPPKAELKASSPLRRLQRNTNPLSGMGSYTFLYETNGWTPEDLCLSYALTEPALATVQFDVVDPGRIEKLAAVPDREPPAALGAQIEMARFHEEAAHRRA